ncbi:retinal pigment epithelial membrane protein [Microthyrium microscopicum]|uniref:Retinal pigment epithelial membrane protein n=1 Tax=Microthyrium microscopicum TaxID=703497 RepID=A0A6A6UEE2_9PEZI|nr:retinal pigment epithelial membrane protein [Microthyrium microscopicum]
MKAKKIKIEKTQSTHPYLAGNFAPIHSNRPLTQCTYTGRIPLSLAGGQYVRNGANPLLNDELDRDCHWFDGDGMLTGVLFRRLKGGRIQPEFVNNWIETDILKASKKSKTSTSNFLDLTRPITPSIATLINPYHGIWIAIYEILRTVVIMIFSFLPWSTARIGKISVANTAILYHDGRALATCESGPPMRVGLPQLETLGWFNGAFVEGEDTVDDQVKSPQFGTGLQMTTAHPKVDPQTGEMIIFHNIFISPFVRYSVLQSSNGCPENEPRVFNAPVPGITSAKLMHDFGVSEKHSVVLDAPMSIKPMNIALGKPMVEYNPSQPCRFGVFPRHHPENVQWFEDEPCVITHTANTWDEYDKEGNVSAVCMLACRMTSPDIIYTSGNIQPPPILPKSSHWQLSNDESSQQINFQDADEEKALLSRRQDEEDSKGTENHSCRLHYWRFPLQSSNLKLHPSHSFALSALDMEFPTVAPGKSLQNARFVYGCSSTIATVNAASGSAVKIDIITKMHTSKLVQRGRHDQSRSGQAVDNRSWTDLASAQSSEDDLVQAFALPSGVYAGEARFVSNGGPEEDDGHLLFFTFDESQLLPNGEAPGSAFSELWILDAKGMKDVVAKVQLVQRVPYGLHGEWFSEEQIEKQRHWSDPNLLTHQ